MIGARSPVLRFLGVRKVPLKYKVRTEDQRKEDFNLIRHNSVTVWAASAVRMLELLASLCGVPGVVLCSTLQCPWALPRSRSRSK